MERPDAERLVRARNGDRDASEQLLVENSGLIWSVARRYFGHGVEPDDLYQLGCLGFIKALEGFDTSYGTQFSTYAVPKIAGEIRRFIRDDGAVKVSRTLKEQAYAVKNARRKLEQRLCREPTVGELSDETGFEPEEIAACELAVTAPESLQKEKCEDGMTLDEVLSETESEDILLEKITLRHAVNELPERERSVIVLRFYHGLTQDKTAGILSVSQVQVSRLERKAVMHLREMMA